MTTQQNNDGATAARPCGAWGQRVGGFTGLPAFLRALGMDPSSVLDSAGLARDALDAPDSRIGYDALGRLLEVSARKAAYPHCGLTAGRMWHLEDLGTLGELVRHSPSVGEAVQSLMLYQHVHSEGGLAFAARHGSLVEVGYAIYYPGVAGADQIYDFALAWIFNFLRELCGPGWLPTQVLIPHAKPADVVHYRNLFKVLPQFDSEVCAIRFPAVWLDRNVEGADPERRRAALAELRDGNGPDLVQQVYRALRDALLCGRSSGNDVANALSMHRRTLNRRLQECGTTFQSVLDEVRCESARQLLCYSEVTLDDIAASLGYAGVSPFMRSFRRWTGLSPGRMRRQAVKGRRELGAAGPANDKTARPSAPSSMLCCPVASPIVPEGKRAPGWRVARESGVIASAGASQLAAPPGKPRAWAPVPARNRSPASGVRAAPWPAQRRLAHT